MSSTTPAFSTDVATPSANGAPTAVVASGALEARVARLERTNRLLSMAIVAAVGVGAGAVMMAARQGAASDAPAAATCKPVSIVLDPSRGSGRWNSTLLAVDEQGVVYALDTSRPQAVWRRFQFSP